jgi:hypothetical protein
MGTLAEIAIVDYRLSFADQRKLASVFRLQKTNGICRFPLVPFSELQKHGEMEIGR